jgi:hypothetical protein
MVALVANSKGAYVRGRDAPIPPTPNLTSVRVDQEQAHRTAG